MRDAIIVVLCCFYISNVFAQDSTNVSGDLEVSQEDPIAKERWYIPHVSLQFAGGIGMFSIGLGYTYWKKRIQSDLFFGFVPKSHAKTDLFIFTVKQTFYLFKFKKQIINRPVYFFPLSMGGSASIYNLNPRNTEVYPVIPYSMMFNYFVGGKVEIGMKKGFLNSVGIFYELGSNYIETQAYLRNQNTIKFTEIFNLGLGVTVKIR